MSVEKRNFGFIAGKGDVEIYKITNDNGAFVELMTLGAGVQTVISAMSFWDLMMLMIMLILI